MNSYFVMLGSRHSSVEGLAFGMFRWRNYRGETVESETQTAESEQRGTYTRKLLRARNKICQEMRFSAEAVMYAARMNGQTGGKRVPVALTIRVRSFTGWKGCPSKFLNFRPAILFTARETFSVENRLIIIRDKSLAISRRKRSIEMASRRRSCIPLGSTCWEIFERKVDVDGAS